MAKGQHTGYEKTQLVRRPTTTRERGRLAGRIGSRRRGSCAINRATNPSAPELRRISWQRKGGLAEGQLKQATQYLAKARQLQRLGYSDCDVEINALSGELGEK